jgi:uncharacterized membrane protein HdeD (DUF308 family)
MAEPDMAAERSGEVRWARWAFVIAGFLSMVAGVIVLDDPENSLAAIAVVIGIFLVIDGIVDMLLSAFSATDRRALTVLIGVVSIVVGIILIRHPIRSVVAVAMFTGLWLIVAGAVRLAWAFDQRQGRLWKLLVAIVEMVGGIVIVASPGIGVATLAVLVGIALILRGIAVSTAAWLVHQVAEDSRRPAHGPVAAT